MLGLVPRLQAAVVARAPDSARGFLDHPAGPFTIHFWAPTAKWLISAANIADLNRPVEKMSANQQGGACPGASSSSSAFCRGARRGSRTRLHFFSRTRAYA